MKNLITTLFISILIISCQTNKKETIENQKNSLNTSGQGFDKNELEVKIDALIPSQVNDSTPGLVIGIVQKGELIFSKGYGLANISYSISNDPKMVYNIGSVSKQFLGYAFAMLHEKGDLNIDDSVNKYLEDWPTFKHTVTLRHLLSHTSGYREAYTMSNLAGRIVGIDRLTREECLNVVRKQPQLEFIPGSRYTYNSTAWVILSDILEKVTGVPTDKWVETNIFKPLEMNKTQIETYVGDVILDAAESYTFTKEKGYTKQNGNRAIFGGADIYSNMADLVKWLNNYRSPKIGDKVVNDLFFEPFILNDGSNSEYALGIQNSTYRRLKRFRHTGVHEAFQTQISYYPDYDLGIIILSNYGDSGWLSTTKIAKILLGEHMSSSLNYDDKEIEVGKEKLEQFKGLYLASTGNKTINLIMVEGSLTMKDKTKLIPTSQNIFRINGRGSKIQIKNLPKGKKQLKIIGSTTKTYTKVEEWFPTEEDLTFFAGDYWSDELETIYHLGIKNGELTMKHRWLDDIALAPISKDLFKSDWGYYIKMTRNNAGDVTGLIINSGRTLNVFFSKK